MIAQASPANTGNAAASDLLVRTLIDPAMANVETQFKDQPLVRATIQQTLADTLYALGKYDLSLKQAQAALATRHGLLGDDSLDTLASVDRVASDLDKLGRAKEAEPLARDALARWQRLRGDDDRGTIAALMAVGETLRRQVRNAEAEPICKQAWERARRVLGEDDPATLNALDAYAAAVDAQNRPAEAEPLFKQAWDGRRRTLGEDNPGTILALMNYANSLLEQHRYAQAEPLLKQVWDRDRRVLGDDHPFTVGARNEYIGVLAGQGKENEFGATTRPTGAAAAARAEGDALLKKRQWRDAEPAFLKAVELDRAAGDTGRFDLVVDPMRLGDSIEGQGRTRWPDAITADREAHTILHTDRPANDPTRLDCGRKFGELLNHADKLTESIDVYRQVVAAAGGVVGQGEQAARPRRRPRRRGDCTHPAISVTSSVVPPGYAAIRLTVSTAPRGSSPAPTPTRSPNNRSPSAPLRVRDTSYFPHPPGKYRPAACCRPGSSTCWASSPAAMSSS